MKIINQTLSALYYMQAECNMAHRDVIKKNYIL